MRNAATTAPANPNIHARPKLGKSRVTAPLPFVLALEEDGSAFVLLKGIADFEGEVGLVYAVMHKTPKCPNG